MTRSIRSRCPAAALAVAALFLLSTCAGPAPVRPTAAFQAWWLLSGATPGELSRALRQHGYRLERSPDAPGGAQADGRGGVLQLAISADTESPNWRMELRSAAETHSLLVTTDLAVVEMIRAGEEPVLVLALEAFRPWLESLLAEVETTVELRWYADPPSESQLRRLAEDRRETGQGDGFAVALLGAATGEAVVGLSTGAMPFGTPYPVSSPRPTHQIAWTTLDPRVALESLLSESGATVPAAVMFAAGEPIVEEVGEEGQSE